MFRAFKSKLEKSIIERIKIILNVESLIQLFEAPLSL